MSARGAWFLSSMLLAASAAAIEARADGLQTAAMPQSAPGVALGVVSTNSKAATQVRDLGGDSERLLVELTRQTEAAKAEFEQLRVDSAAAHARTVSRGRVYVRLARAGLLPVAGGFEALVDHAARLERLRSAIGRDVSLERELNARRVALGRRLTDLEARRSTLETEVQAMSVAEGALLSEQDRADAFLSAFSSSVGASHTAVYGAGMGPSDVAAHAGGFAELKGRLPFPITGRSEIRTARRPGAEGPGLDMFAPAGSVVRAVDAGRVAFADTYAAYGKTVILDHGAGYYTVSANLDAVDVQVGDDVASGSRIGTVGSDGSAPRLYFEIRVGTNTVAAADWFGI